jgi:ATP-binding cassette, subfamily B, multidrug efflux pump
MPMKHRGTLRLFATRYAWPHRWSFAGGAVCLLMTNWLTVTIPISLGAGIDAMTEGGNVLDAVLSITAMGLAIIVVRTLSRVLFFNPGRDMEYQIRRDLFSHLLNLQPEFYARHRTGDIVSRASNDISWTRAMVGFGLMQVVNTTVAITLTGWRMIGISTELTLWTLVPIILALTAIQFFLRQLFVLQKQSQMELGDISDHVLGTFQGIATVQGFSAEPAFIEGLEKRNLAWHRTTMRLSVIRSLAFPLLGLAGGIGVFLLLYVGGPAAVAGELSVGDLAAFSALIAALLPPLRSLGWMLSVLQRGRASLERIFELLDEVVTTPESVQPPTTMGGNAPALRIDGLNFAYPDKPDRPVLRQVSLNIPPGSVLGIVGRTGSGKTSLLRVLARLYDPPQGTVFTDGTDITTVDRAAWRRRLAMAPQRPFLFSETIADNIALGLDTNTEAITCAATQAALGSDLQVLPQGLDTVVGQRGIMLSGGQRQRVALARALIRDADLVLLDDVLSAVDHGTEQALVSSLHAPEGEISPTVVIVSNRISALRHADNIVVLEDGAVVDQGTHAELSQRPGLYQDILEVQRT